MLVDLLQVLSRETVRQLRCLVVLPVHDLAVQVTTPRNI